MAITKVNGKPNQGKCTSTTLPVEFRELVPVQRAVMEEATGTCWTACTRGTMAIQNLTECFGERFIGAAYHKKDPMMTAVEAPFAIPHYPSAVLDRGPIIDPYYGDSNNQVPSNYRILPMVDQALRRATTAGVDIASEWEDEACTRIKVKSGVVFVDGCKQEGYTVKFLLLTNGLTGNHETDEKIKEEWWQSNSLNGGTAEELGEVLAPMGTSGNPIKDAVYDHVVVMASEEAAAVDATLSPLQSQCLSCTFDTSKAVSTFGKTEGENLIQNKDKLDVVALLLRPDGTIENAVKAPVGKATSAIETVSADRRVVSDEYYDLQGRKVSADTKGLSIRLTRYSDGTTRAAKVIK
ncbi:MAG: hypothetical protein NC402_08020 [Prevotella sp.]|nr:hypothetical protein [Prevotella sp.]MCM1075643.1 hypothetical protein [Ruminococcus sp.]